MFQRVRHIAPVVNYVLGSSWLLLGGQRYVVRGLKNGSCQNASEVGNADNQNPQVRPFVSCTSHMYQVSLSRCPFNSIGARCELKKWYLKTLYKGHHWIRRAKISLEAPQLHAVMPVTTCCCRNRQKLSIDLITDYAENRGGSTRKEPFCDAHPALEN